MRFRPAKLSYDDIRSLAGEFLDEFHEERTLPVPVEEIIEFDFEIQVIPVDGILDELEVDAFLTSDLEHIYVDEFVMTHRRKRFRFSLAHEIGHFQLHRPLYEEARIRSVRDWERLQQAISEDDYAWLEFQANAFAGLILVPPAQLKARFRSALALAKKTGLSDITLQSEAGKTYIANWLAERFDVSAEVIEKRLEKDGLWALPSGGP